MDKFEAREWIEIGKMFKKLKEKGTQLQYDLETDNYNMVKEVYFEDVLGHKETSIITLDLDEDVWDKIAETADAQDITMDEVLCNLLKEYIDKLPKNYRLVQKGELLEDGDEVWSAGEMWAPFFGEVNGQALKIDRPVRRLVK